VRQALKINPDLTAVADTIGIEDSHGIVTLFGTVPSQEVAAACQLVAASVINVTGVANKLDCPVEAAPAEKPTPAEPSEGMGITNVRGFMTTAGLGSTVVNTSLGQDEMATGGVPVRAEGATGTPTEPGVPQVVPVDIGGTFATPPEDVESEPVERKPVTPGPAAPSHGIVLDETGGTFNVPAVPVVAVKSGAGETPEGESAEKPTPAAPSAGMGIENIRGFATTAGLVSTMDATAEAQEEMPTGGMPVKDEGPAGEVAPSEPGVPQVVPVDVGGIFAAPPEDVASAQAEREPVAPGPAAPSHGLVLDETGGTFNVPTVTPVPEVPGAEKPVPRQAGEKTKAEPTSMGVILEESEGMTSTIAYDVNTESEKPK